MKIKAQKSKSLTSFLTLAALRLGTAQARDKSAPTRRSCGSKRRLLVSKEIHYTPRAALP